MWTNEEFASRHIKKHGTTPAEAWEVVFEDPEAVPITAMDQLTWPPFRRWYTIGKTKEGRILFVVWDQNKNVKNLITCFSPDKTRREIYERAKKKKPTR